DRDRGRAEVAVGAVVESLHARDLLDPSYAGLPGQGTCLAGRHGRREAVGQGERPAYVEASDRPLRGGDSQPGDDHVEALVSPRSAQPDLERVVDMVAVEVSVRGRRRRLRG